MSNIMNACCLASNDLETNQQDSLYNNQTNSNQLNTEFVYLIKKWIVYMLKLTKSGKEKSTDYSKLDILVSLLKVEYDESVHKVCGNLMFIKHKSNSYIIFC